MERPYLRVPLLVKKHRVFWLREGHGEPCLYRLLYQLFGPIRPLTRGVVVLSMSVRLILLQRERLLVLSYACQQRRPHGAQRDTYLHTALGGNPLDVCAVKPDLQPHTCSLACPFVR
jgi:hypothetical protein